MNDEIKHLKNTVSILLSQNVRLNKRLVALENLVSTLADHHLGTVDRYESGEWIEFDRSRLKSVKGVV